MATALSGYANGDTCLRKAVGMAPNIGRIDAYVRAASTDEQGAMMLIEHFALNVPNPVAMAEWWVRHLGLRVVRQVDGPPHTRFLADEAGRGVLEIYQQTKAEIPDYFSFDPLVVHVAFVVKDIRAEEKRLLAAGATSAAEIVVTPQGDEMTFLRDPWGVVIQLVKRVKALV